MLFSLFISHNSPIICEVNDLDQAQRSLCSKIRSVGEVRCGEKREKKGDVGVQPSSAVGSETDWM